MLYVTVLVAVLAVGTVGAMEMDCSHCLSGYCDGYESCEYGCADGWFNRDCQRPCWENCLYGACDRWTGYCLHGCANNTQGVFCDEPCQRGCDDAAYCYAIEDYDFCPSGYECSLCDCQGLGCVVAGATLTTSTLTPPFLLLAALLTTCLMG